MGNSTALGSEMGNGDKVVNFLFNPTNNFTGTVSTPTSTPTLALQSTSIGRRLLSSVTVSTAVASVDFTSLITSQFKNYMLEFDNLAPSTNAVMARYRVSQNNGSTWITDYVVESWGHEAISDTYARTGANWNECNMNPDAWGVGNNTNHKAAGFIYMTDPNSTAGFKGFRGELIFDAGVSTYVMNMRFSAFTKVVGAVNAIKFYFSPGNIASGNFRFYGIN